jgi:hypothetical protein
MIKEGRKDKGRTEGRTKEGSSHSSLPSFPSFRGIFIDAEKEGRKRKEGRKEGKKEVKDGRERGKWRKVGS